jgi:DNA-binding MarR family transcriptional regulator
MVVVNRTAVNEGDVADLAHVLERTTSWLRRSTRGEEWNTVALSVLDELDRGGPRRITELSTLERSSQPGMTGIVGRLEAAGLVLRAPDPTDGRAVLVSATRAGRTYIAERHAVRAAFVADRITSLSDDDRRALLAATSALAALIEGPQ